MSKFNKRCSFCGAKEEDEVSLVGSNGSFICNNCIEVANNILEEQKIESINEQLKEIPTPREIKEFLDDYVIGQEDAKKVLSVAVYNHYRRITNQHKNEIELDKSNILMIGPTGTGKTLLAKTLAKKLQVPFAIADATTLTEAGYVGEDVENILLKLIQNADYDIERAQRGIIFVDEIDKISKKGENVSITRDVSGEGVQQALLKIIEGTTASVPPQGGRKHPGQEMLKLDTTNILFICGGAFVGLDKIIEKRTTKNSIGFGADIKTYKDEHLSELLRLVQADDLIKFGLIPEFIGRLPIHVALNNLNKEDLMHIIVEPKNSIVKQYKAALSIEDCELEFKKDAIEAIADKALEEKTGARGLRSIVENTMLNIMYELPSHKDINKIVIEKETITENKKPLAYSNNKLVEL